MKTLAIISTTLLLAVLVFGSKQAPTTEAGAAGFTGAGGVTISELPVDRAFSVIFDTATFPTNVPSILNWPSTSSSFNSLRVFEGPVAMGQALVLTNIEVLAGNSSADIGYVQFAVGVDGNPVYFRVQERNLVPGSPMQPIVVRENQLLRVEADWPGETRILLQGFAIDMADL